MNKDSINRIENFTAKAKEFSDDTKTARPVVMSFTARIKPMSKTAKVNQ